jgi:hypothetical protein
MMTVGQRLTCLAFVMAAAISVAFVAVLKPVSAGSFLFWSVWLAWPHAALAAVVVISMRRGRLARAVQSAALLVSLLGPVLLVDAVFLHPDAQGALGVLIVPIVQLGCGVMSFLAIWSYERWTRP